MDREKIIDHLQIIHIWASVGKDPIYNGIEPKCCEDIEKWTKDALSLLKEQEAVEPTLIREGRNKHYNDYVCPRCDNEVVYKQNYCSECGVEFLWEGR